MWLSWYIKCVTKSQPSPPESPFQSVTTALPPQRKLMHYGPNMVNHQPHMGAGTVSVVSGSAGSPTTHLQTPPRKLLARGGDKSKERERPPIRDKASNSQQSTNNQGSGGMKTQPSQTSGLSGQFSNPDMGADRPAATLGRQIAVNADSPSSGGAGSTASAPRQDSSTGTPGATATPVDCDTQPRAAGTDARGLLC